MVVLQIFPIKLFPFYAIFIKLFSLNFQVKRFTNDLLKVLKAQPSKQISILDLPLCFEKSLTRHFKIADYGVKFLIRKLVLF